MTELHPGQIVSGVVVEHRHYAVHVEIGEAEPGVAVITMLEVDPRSRDPRFPAVGERVESVFLGYSGPGRQPRLSLRSADLEAARTDS